MKKVVVFGATGNLGAHISVHLHQLGYDVIPVGHRKNEENQRRSERIKKIMVFFRTME